MCMYYLHKKKKKEDRMGWREGGEGGREWRESKGKKRGEEGKMNTCW